MRGLAAWRRSAAASVAGRKWVWTSMVIEAPCLLALAAAMGIHSTNGSARPRRHSGDGRASGTWGADPRGGPVAGGAHVIGLDLTPELFETARRRAAEHSVAI